VKGALWAVKVGRRAAKAAPYLMARRYGPGGASGIARAGLRRTMGKYLKRAAGAAGLGVAAAMTRSKVRRVSSKKRKGTRRVRSGPSAQFGQWQKSRKRTGRRVSRQSVVNKLTLGNVSNLRYQFKGLGQFTGDQGFFALTNMTGTAAAQQFLPVYMVDLTTVRNSNTTGTGVMFRLSYTPSNNVWTWVATAGLDLAGASSSAMSVLTNPTSNSTTIGVPGQRGYLDWVRTRLNLYGQTSRPVTITAKIIKPTVDWFSPKKQVQYVPTGDADNLAAINYWAQHLKSKLTNPIASQYGVVPKAPFKVLDSKTVTFEPKENSDVDPDPFCRTIDWFWRAGSVHSFVKPTGLTNQWDDPDKNVQAGVNDGNCESSPYPETAARWMLITADVYTTVATDVGWTAAVAPSFDMNLETCWKLMV